MIYKIEVINKDNISKIRYIGNNINSLEKLIEIDEFRDLANSLMLKNPSLTYNNAYKQVKDMKYGSDTSNMRSKVYVQTLTASPYSLPVTENTNAA